MEIGAEISQKIRSAITAKLVDLGAYVDDELPDYIMVMIANKKSKAQMTEDLNLFLGNNTERFTQWLHALLSKLQTITGDSQKSGSAPSASASTGSNTQGAPPTQPQSHGTNGTANTDSVGSASNTAAKLAVQRERETAAEEPEEPVIKLRADNDEFAEEEPVSSPVTSPKKKENKVAPRVRDPAPSQVVPKTRAVTVTRVQPRLRPTAEPAMRSDRIKPVQQMKVVKTVARKRKMPGSVVGSVVKHYSEEEDEGYDPLKPAIGSVASVIRVTERKSSVPHHLQANKNLVMKAVQEAHQSLEHLSRKVDITTAHAHAEQAVVRPMESMVADRVTVKTRHRKTPIVRSTMHKQRVTRTRGSPISKSTAVQLVSRSKREEQVGRLTHTSSSKGQGGQKDEETVDEAVRHVLGGEDEFVSEEELRHAKHLGHSRSLESSRSYKYESHSRRHKSDQGYVEREQWLENGVSHHQYDQIVMMKGDDGKYYVPHQSRNKYLGGDEYHTRELDHYGNIILQKSRQREGYDYDDYRSRSRDVDTDARSKNWLLSYEGSRSRDKAYEDFYHHRLSKQKYYDAQFDHYNLSKEKYYDVHFDQTLSSNRNLSHNYDRSYCRSAYDDIDYYYKNWSVDRQHDHSYDTSRSRHRVYDKYVYERRTPDESSDDICVHKLYNKGELYLINDKNYHRVKEFDHKYELVKKQKRSRESDYTDDEYHPRRREFDHDLDSHHARKTESPSHYYQYTSRSNVSSMGSQRMKSTATSSCSSKDDSWRSSSGSMVEEDVEGSVVETNSGTESNVEYFVMEEEDSQTQGFETAHSEVSDNEHLKFQVSAPEPNGCSASQWKDEVLHQPETTRFKDAQEEALMLELKKFKAPRMEAPRIKDKKLKAPRIEFPESKDAEVELFSIEECESRGEPCQAPTRKTPKIDCTSWTLKVAQWQMEYEAMATERESTPSPESVESSTEVDCRLVECNDEETDIRKPVVVKVANPPQNKHAPKLAEAKPQPVTILLHPQPSSDISEEEEEEEDSGESKTQGGESESLQGQEDEEYRDVESESEEVSYEVQQEEQKEDIKRTIKQKHRHKERPVSPKFVVTLDGVDPKLLKDAVPMEIDSDEERQLTGQTSEEQHLPQVTVDMGDTSGEYDQEDEVPTKKSKLPERCKFWPSCKNGESCAFHHPNTQCTVFPKCRFGDKCLYIHPNCKFDANCTRPNCPYTHASKRPTTVPVVLQPIQVPVMSTPKPSYATQPKATSPTSPGQIKCRFFPACTNMSCRFKHPKPCRYGISCNNKEKCPFTHPQLPDRKKLKWSSAPSKLGESTSLTKT